MFFSFQRAKLIDILKLRKQNADYFEKIPEKKPLHTCFKGKIVVTLP